MKNKFNDILSLAKSKPEPQQSPLETIELGNGYFLVHTHTEAPEVTDRAKGYGDLQYFEVRHPASEHILAGLTGMIGEEVEPVIKVGVIAEEHKAPGMAKNVHGALEKRFGSCPEEVLSFLQTSWGDEEETPSVEEKHKIGNWEKFEDVFSFFEGELEKSLSASELLDALTLDKGARRKQYPLSSQDRNVHEREKTFGWVDPDPTRHDTPRNEVPEMKGPSKDRAVHSLFGKTPHRRNPTSGDLEFLMHRGMSKREAEDNVSDKGYRSAETSSWSIHPEVAHTFASDYRESYDEDKHLISAWVPAAAIRNIPMQLAHPDQAADTDHLDIEGEVIVNPHDTHFEHASREDTLSHMSSKHSGKPIRTRVNEKQSLNALMNLFGSRHQKSEGLAKSTMIKLAGKPGWHELTDIKDSGIPAHEPGGGNHYTFTHGKTGETHTVHQSEVEDMAESEDLTKIQYYRKYPSKNFLKKDKIPGGLADKKDPKDFDSRELDQGKEVESEHTSEPEIAEEIAMDHLSEDPKYYDKLEIMESDKFDQVLSSLPKMKKFAAGFGGMGSAGATGTRALIKSSKERESKLLTLAGETRVGVDGATGARSFLLFRGMREDEFKASVEPDVRVRSEGHATWSPYPDIAMKFSPTGYLVGAWISEKNLIMQTMPADKQMDEDTGHLSLYRVLVKPHESRILNSDQTQSIIDHYNDKKEDSDADQQEA